MLLPRTPWLRVLLSLLLGAIFGAAWGFVAGVIGAAIWFLADSIVDRTVLSSLGQIIGLAFLFGFLLGISSLGVGAISFAVILNTHLRRLFQVLIGAVCGLIAGIFFIPFFLSLDPNSAQVAYLSVLLIVVGVLNAISAGRLQRRFGHH
jgi:hypothetical protein